MATYKSAKIAWSFLAASKEVPSHEVEESYKRLSQRIKRAEAPAKRLPFLKYAAALVLLIGISSIMFWLGGNYKINKKQSVHYSTVVAEYGQIAHVILPDSSVVWLNSGTKLTYSNDFAVNSRHLKLEGQAFFEISKNKNLPLKVATEAGISVKVLGTKFDVKAYPGDDQVNVVLEEGSVELESFKNQGTKQKLVPGEMMTYNVSENRMNIARIETGDYTSWKEGALVFKDEPMQQVIRKLERRYNVEVEVINTAVYQSIFNANFKNESLKEILDFIEFSCPITYQLVDEGEGKTKIILK
ncbi:FecR family protein [Sunxiuqinia rutila]|uniref:FecR family protein n=1 Tax=Sunxiuqinia rutila TaxID=1397841 RepID=UPI003D3663C2